MQLSQQHAKLLNTFLAVFSMALLFSCSKNLAGDPGSGNTALSALKQAPASQAANSETSIPVDRTLFVQCANGGAGEEITLTGKVHTVFQIVFNQHGVMLTYQSNMYGVTGVGLSTGDTFIAS